MTRCQQQLLCAQHMQGRLDLRLLTADIVESVGGAVTRPMGNVLKLAFHKLWNSLEVTFLYEHFLLELRHLAFEGKSHLGEV